MGRPKGSVNKKQSMVKPLAILPVHKVRLSAIKDVDKYITKRAYWYMLAIEKKLMVDPTSVTPDVYMKAVTNYTDRMRVYEAAYKGMVKKRITSRTPKSGGSGGTGQNGSSDMGVGIPATNPIT